jgi:hypothetical protein
MPNEITISGITGSSPFDIYTSDTGETTTIYINTVGATDLPYTFDVPIIFQPLPAVNVKIIDTINCEINETIIF